MNALPTPVQIERVAWRDALARMDWRPGEHVTLVGPNGAGKTELIIELVGQRRWVLFLGTKRIDDTQEKLRGLGFRRIKDASEINPQIASRYWFKPDWPRGYSASRLMAYQSAAFREALMAAFRQTGWTTVGDEGRYLSSNLGLKDELILHLIQGRSQKNSLVSGTQRPRYVPLEMYDQASHLFFWRDNDALNIARVAEMAGINRAQVAAIVPGLDRHDVLYIAPFTGEMFITNTRW